MNVHASDGSALTSKASSKVNLLSDILTDGIVQP